MEGGGGEGKENKLFRLHVEVQWAEELANTISLWLCLIWCSSNISFSCGLAVHSSFFLPVFIDIQYGLGSLCSLAFCGNINFFLFPTQSPILTVIVII